MNSSCLILLEGKTRFRIAVFAPLFLSLSISVSLGDDQFRTVAVRGDASPVDNGDSDGPDFLGFPAAPVINNRGEVAFIGEVDSRNRSVIFREDRNRLMRVVGLGDSYSGILPKPTVNRFRETTLSFNDSGQVAFAGGFQVNGTSVTADSDEAVFTTNSSDQIEYVAREGDLAVGLVPASTLTQFTDISPVNESGGLTFFANAINASDNSNFALFKSDGSNPPRSIARIGDSLLVQGRSVQLDGIAFSDPVLNNAGQAAF